MAASEDSGSAKKSYYTCKEISSFKIFSEFISYNDNGECDATRILERPCYDAWLKSRRCFPKSPHEAFRRAVTAHVRGNDGRRPFPKAAEASLLVELRQKKQWKAFHGTGLLVGIKGFSSLGHHEKLELFRKPSVQSRQKRQRSCSSEEDCNESEGFSCPTAKKCKPWRINLNTEANAKVNMFDVELKFLTKERGVLDSLEELYRGAKSCYQQRDGFQSFDPMLDEMIDLRGYNLNGIEYPMVFERSLIAEPLC